MKVVEVTPEYAAELISQYQAMSDLDLSYEQAREIVERYLARMAERGLVVMANTTYSAPKAPAPKPAPGGRTYNQIRQAAQASHGLTPRQVVKAEAYDYKTHFLLGRRAEDGATLTIARWPHLPTTDEINKAVAGSKNTYVSFALTNPVNVWDA